MVDKLSGDLDVESALAMLGQFNHNLVLTALDQVSLGSICRYALTRQDAVSLKDESSHERSMVLRLILLHVVVVGSEDSAESISIDSWLLVSVARVCCAFRPWLRVGCCSA